jgi:hypothetical protein
VAADAQAAKILGQRMGAGNDSGSGEAKVEA